MKKKAGGKMDAGREHEDDMIARARSGDLQAFDRLIRRYQDQVFSVAFRLVGNEDDAADITQEVFLACFRHLKDYRGESKFSTWLYRITVNMVKNHWSRQKRNEREHSRPLERVEDSEEMAVIDCVADAAPNPRQVAASAEMVRLLETKLMEIDPEFREVIVLRFVEGLSYEEIAQVTGQPLGTVKSRIFRARRALKERMAPYLREARE